MCLVTLQAVATAREDGGGKLGIRPCSGDGGAGILGSADRPMLQ